MSCPICGMPPRDGEPCCTREYAVQAIKRAEATNAMLRADFKKCWEALEPMQPEDNGQFLWDVIARRKALTAFAEKVLAILRERGPIFLQAVLRSDQHAASCLGRIYGEALGASLIRQPSADEWSKS